MELCVICGLKIEKKIPMLALFEFLRKKIIIM
jgi:hypothetical protein